MCYRLQFSRDIENHTFYKSQPPLEVLFFLNHQIACFYQSCTSHRAPTKQYSLIRVFCALDVHKEVLCRRSSASCNNGPWLAVLRRASLHLNGDAGVAFSRCAHAWRRLHTTDRDNPQRKTGQYAWGSGGRGGDMLLMKVGCI